MKYKNVETTFADMAMAEMKYDENYLDKVAILLDWARIEKLLIKKISKVKAAVSATGSSAYHPLFMFKILLLQRFENMSDPQLEKALKDRLSFMRFTGIGLSDAKPDHSTISRFRTLLVKLKLYEKLFEEVSKQLAEKGLMVKKRDHAIVDATIISSSRRSRKVVENIEEDRKEKDDDDQNGGSGSGTKTTCSDDHDAAWIKKGKKSHYGFKAHVAVDSEGFLLGGHVTPANKSDIKELAQVLEESNIEEKSFILADKGYASAENRDYLKDKGHTDFIMAKANKNKPLTPSEKLINRAISSVRYKVEQTFGILKKHYGLSRARYLGISKMSYEIFMCGLCMNLKKAVAKVKLCHFWG